MFCIANIRALAKLGQKSEPKKYSHTSTYEKSQVRLLVKQIINNNNKELLTHILDKEMTKIIGNYLKIIQAIDLNTIWNKKIIFLRVN